MATLAPTPVAVLLLAVSITGCEATRRNRGPDSGWTSTPSGAESPLSGPQTDLTGGALPSGYAPDEGAVTTIEEGGVVYRNTYYDFPSEGEGVKDGVLFDGQCNRLAQVVRAFHDQVCVQGSGRLSSGETVSFARRDCECADVCPRTGQKICFDKLDPKRFPTGRGATGSPVTPLRSVAVDTSVIPLGTLLYIPEYVGLPRPDGSSHDGCFIAEDRGSKVVGRHVDIFTGAPSVTDKWNKLVPSNTGVHVVVGGAECR